MFFRKWRQKQRLKKFRPILTMQMTASYNRSSHLTLLKAKKILREVKTSIVKKEEHIHHIHHNMTMNVHQAQTILQLYSPSNDRNVYVKSLRMVNKKLPVLRLQLPSVHLSKNGLIDHRLREEKTYYRYHPAKARALAQSYIQNAETQKYLQEYMQKSIHVSKTELRHMQLSSLHTTISAQSWKQALYPVIKKQSRELIHRELHTSLKQKEHTVSAEQIHTIKETTPQPIGYSVNEEALIRRILQEVERRSMRERLRKGRR